MRCTLISGPNSDITLVKKILEATQPDPVIEDFPVVTLDVIYQLFQENNINLNNFLKLIMRNLSVFDGNHLSHVVKFLQNHSNNFSDNVLCEVFLYLYKNKNKNVIDYFLIHFQSALKKGTVQNIHLIDYALKMVDSDLLRMLVKAGIDREKSLGQHEWEQLLINEDKKLNDTLTQLTEEKPSTALAKQTLSLGSPYHEEEIKSIRQTFFSSMDSKLKKNAERAYSTILTNDNKLFTIRDSIGAGGRSKIKLAYHHSRKNWCVVKIIKINKDFVFSDPFSLFLFLSKSERRLGR